MQVSDDDKQSQTDLTAYYAVYELHHGRIEWLGEHIRRSNFEISPLVARKILDLIEQADEECSFELRLARRSDLPPAQKDAFAKRVRNLEMAVEVAKRGGFERAQNKRACHDVGKLPKYGLTGPVVSKLVRPLREVALGIVGEEAKERDFREGKVDFLGCPK